MTIVSMLPVCYLPSGAHRGRFHHHPIRLGINATRARGGGGREEGRGWERRSVRPFSSFCVSFRLCKRVVVVVDTRLWWFRSFRFFLVELRQVDGHARVPASDYMPDSCSSLMNQCVIRKGEYARARARIIWGSCSTRVLMQHPHVRRRLKAIADIDSARD